MHTHIPRYKHTNKHRHTRVHAHTYKEFKNKTLMNRNLKIHYEITRKSTPKSLSFYTEAKQKYYNEENKKLRKPNALLF